MDFAVIQLFWGLRRIVDGFNLKLISPLDFLRLLFWGLLHILGECFSCVQSFSNSCASSLVVISTHKLVVDIASAW